MNITNRLHRREAMRLASLGLAAAASGTGANSDPKLVAKKPTNDFHGLKVGLASYSTRKLSVDDTIACCKRVAVHYIALKDAHLKLTSTPEERRAVRQKFADSGIQVVGCGVIYLKNDEAEIRHALEYARDLGAATAVVGSNAETVPTIAKVVKDFDLRVAIHNHGPEDKLGAYSPLDVFEWVKNVDTRVGICLDAGHTLRCGVDPSAAAVQCASRLYDIHNKDLAEAAPKSKGVPLGQGVIDAAGFLKTLVKIRYPYHVALEYEVEENNPVPGISASIGFERGVLAAI